MGRGDWTVKQLLPQVSRGGGRRAGRAWNSPTRAMTKAKTCSSPCRTLVVRLASFLKTR